MKTAERSRRREPITGSWLVSGAGGFIGRALLSELQARGCRAEGAGRSTVPPAGIADKHWHAIDVADHDRFRSLLRTLQPAVLVDAVGHDPAGECSRLGEFYREHAIALLEAVRAEQPLCRVVLLGSAAEYGNSPASGSGETDAPGPLSEYGRAKSEQFAVARRFSAEGLEVITARLFNVIGPGQGSHLLAGGLMKRIRRGEQPLRVFNGNHVRDWIDVRDAARAVALLAETAEPPAVVNVCSGIGRTVASLARAVEQLTGAAIEIEPGSTSPDVPWRSIGNPGRLLSLGWCPRHSLEESLADQWRQASD